MSRALAALLLVLLLISSPVLPQQQPTTGTIEGIVVRADNGRPVASAQVTLTFAPLTAPGAATILANRAAPPKTYDTVLTTADGKFVFPGLPIP